MRWMDVLSAAVASAFLLVAGLAGCTAGADRAEEAPIVVGNAVIFPAHLVKEGEQYLVEQRDADWTPRVEDILLLEERLLEYLASHRRAEEFLSRYRQSRRQYFGITRHGIRWILTNSFCNSDHFGDAWTESIVVMIDAGACYFTVLYDPERDLFAGFLSQPGWDGDGDLERDRGSEIQRLVWTIRAAGPDGEGRFLLAEDLAERVREVWDACELSDAVIDDIGSLLSDRDERVRGVASAALENLRYRSCTP